MKQREGVYTLCGLTTKCSAAPDLIRQLAAQPAAAKMLFAGYVSDGGEECWAVQLPLGVHLTVTHSAGMAAREVRPGDYLCMNASRTIVWGAEAATIHDHWKPIGQIATQDPPL